MKKALILFMCMLLAASCVLVGCDGTTQGDTSKGEGSTGTPGNTEKSQYVDENGKYQLVGMPEFNYENKEFRVAIVSEEGHSTYYNEDINPDLYSTTDQAIKDAVRERNNLVSEDYKVTVKGIAVKDVVAAVKNDVETNTGEYDAVMPFMCNAAQMSRDGHLKELGQYSNVMHLDAPWYDQLALKEGSLAGKHFFVTGDISIMPKIVTFAITFNKEMLRSYYPDVDLYKKVEDHEWTYDYMMELSKGVTEEKDGDSVMTVEDQWGLSSANMDAVTYYLASGEKLCAQDANNLPVLSLGASDRSTNIAMKVLDTLSRSGEWDIRVEEMTGDDVWNLSLSIFAEGRALFRTSAFSAIKKMRNYVNGCQFGLVPMPLMDETQTDYYSPANPTFATVIAIPDSAPNPEFSAYMIEVLSCYGKNLLTPAYYETTLKSRDTKDPESEVMLDNYIFKNIVYDTGRIYSFGNVGTMLTSLMKDGSSKFASTLDSERDTIETEITEFITEIDNK